MSQHAHQQQRARHTLQRSQHALAALHERTNGMQQQPSGEPSVTVSAEQVRYVLTKAQRSIEALEALDPLTLSEPEQEAREHTLEQMEAVVLSIRITYPGVFPLLLVRAKHTS